MNLSSEQQASIDKFVQWTRTEPSTAHQWLSLFGWDYDLASQAYWHEVILTCDYDVDT